MESIGQGNGSRLTDFVKSSRSTTSEKSESSVTNSFAKNPILDAAWKSNPLWDALFERDYSFE